MHQFQLHITKKSGKPKYELYERIANNGSQPKIEYVSCISGWRISLVEHILKKSINIYKGKQLSNSNRFRIEEEDGVRVGLIFSAIQILQKMEKCERIISTIQRMSREEAYYWYSKVRDKELHKGSRALRVLLE